MILMGTRCWRGHDAGRYRCLSCAQCMRERNKTGDSAPYGPLTPQIALWRDGEYQFLREQGLTPQEIGEKHGVRWESFQRTLHRRIGGKAKW